LKQVFQAGLAGFLASAGYPEGTWMRELGKQKVPTLRNVEAPVCGLREGVHSRRVRDDIAHHLPGLAAS
jgi:hypothetical protein